MKQVSDIKCCQMEDFLQLPGASKEASCTEQAAEARNMFRKNVSYSLIQQKVNSRGDAHSLLCEHSLHQKRTEANSGHDMNLLPPALNANASCALHCCQHTVKWS